MLLQFQSNDCCCWTKLSSCLPEQKLPVTWCLLRHQRNTSSNCVGIWADCNCGAFGMAEVALKVKLFLFLICRRLQSSAYFRHMRSHVQTGSSFNHVKLGLFSECVFGFHIHYSLRSVACLSPVRRCKVL